MENKMTSNPQDEMRREFEEWFSGKNDGTCPSVKRYGDGYKLMQTNLSWVAWQRAWEKCSDLPRAVSGGEALEAIEELSCTCDERFMLETKCPKCRLSDLLTRQPVENKPVEQEEFIEKTGYVDIYDKIIASGFIITRKD